MNDTARYLLAQAAVIAAPAVYLLSSGFAPLRKPRLRRVLFGLAAGICVAGSAYLLGEAYHVRTGSALSSIAGWIGIVIWLSGNLTPLAVALAGARYAAGHEHPVLLAFALAAALAAASPVLLAWNGLFIVLFSFE